MTAARHAELHYAAASAHRIAANAHDAASRACALCADEPENDAAVDAAQREEQNATAWTEIAGQHSDAATNAQPSDWTCDGQAAAGRAQDAIDEGEEGTEAMHDSAAEEHRVAAEAHTVAALRSFLTARAPMRGVPFVVAALEDGRIEVRSDARTGRGWNARQRYAIASAFSWLGASLVSNRDDARSCIWSIDVR